ncbi:MAG: DEAD/DEAH box helicase [Buchananella hordeovulneris]|nr:DEAD/DEAH box helicase [Buchananella hordeovulneris]
MPASPSSAPAQPSALPGDSALLGDSAQPQVIDKLLSFLGSAGSRDERLVHLHSTAARPERTAPWPQWANPRVVAGYRRLGVELPWQHQVEAATALYSGHHTVLSTGTGSGKSLPAWLPVLSALADAQDAAMSTNSIAALRQRPTALYLAPTKALAADQAAALGRVVAAAGLDAQVATADGDADRAQKLWARGNADVLLTNPDFLHHALLPRHQGWTRLLRGLETVIVDECHTYRGVFGAHVALVLRRLLRLARLAGANPRVLCASATAADPAVAAARLIGVEPTQVVVVDDDASPRGPQLLALWQPAYVKMPPAGAGAPAGGVQPANGDGQGNEQESQPVRRAEEARQAQGQGESAPAGAAGRAEAAGESGAGGQEVAQRPRISASAEAAWLAARFAALDAQCLVFARSRAGVEGIAEHVRHQLTRGGASQLAEGVAAYRGGYLPEERRALEADLRARKLRLLVTTSALELGIDVSGLDAVITAGWPGSRASIQQQAGRAGRAGAPGLAVFVASANPLDQYLLHHPEFVLGQPEATTFDPTNPHVLRPHLCAAAAESPLQAEDLDLFGLTGWELVEQLGVEGLLRQRPTGWYWNAAIAHPAHELTTLRGEMDQLHVVDKDTGAVIALIEGGARADSTVHPGALYVHQGRLYGVLELRDDTVVVTPRREPGYRTRASSTSLVAPLELLDTTAASAGDWSRAADSRCEWNFGYVEVTGRVTGYDRLSATDAMVLSHHNLDMPERPLSTQGVWWTMPTAVWQEAGLTWEELPGALHAAEHAQIAMLPLLANCDRWDLGGLSTRLHPETQSATVFVYDSLDGGAGFARHAYHHRQEWVEATLDLIEQCPCAAGCPMCVQSPKCGNGNEPLSKTGAVRVLRALLA